MNGERGWRLKEKNKGSDFKGSWGQRGKRFSGWHCREGGGVGVGGGGGGGEGRGGGFRKEEIVEVRGKLWKNVEENRVEKELREINGRRIIAFLEGGRE